MAAQTPKYAYVLAIAAGLVVPFIRDIGTFFILPVVFYVLVGGLLVFYGQKNHGAGGLWLVGLLGVLTVLSVLFAGQPEIFFKKDLPLLVIALCAACLTSFAAALLKRNK